MSRAEKKTGSRWRQVRLHDGALGLLAVLLDAEGDASSLGEGLVDAAVAHGGALEVAKGVDAASNLQSLLVVDHGALLALLALRGTLLLLVIGLAQVALEGDENELDARAVVGDLANPLALNVLEGVLAVDAVA